MGIRQKEVLSILSGIVGWDGVWIGLKGHPVSVHPFLVGLDGKWGDTECGYRTEGTSNVYLFIPLVHWEVLNCQ